MVVLIRSLSVRHGTVRDRLSQCSVIADLELRQAGGD